MKRPFKRMHWVLGIVIAAALATGFGIALRGNSPDSTPRSGADFHPAGPFKIAVAIDPTQPKVGKNRMTIVVRDGNDQPVNDAAIQANAEMPAMGSMPAMRAPADLKLDQAGVYHGQFELSMDGAWPLTLAIASPTKGNATLHFDLTTSRAGLRLTQATPAATAPASTSVPPNTAGGLSAGPYRIAIAFTPDPPIAGPNRIAIDVKDKDGRPVPGARVRAVAQQPSKNDAKPTNIAANVQETEPGRYVATLELPAAGAWALALDVETKDLGHGDLVLDLVTGRPGITVATSTSEGISHYTCSMHPSVKSATPGTCPICGMDLVPVTKQEVQSGTILVDARRRQLIGVTTGPVERRRLTQTVRAAGRITYDETRLADITLKFDGWIGKLYADSVGAPVKRGTALFTVYSPALLSAQQEYLETWRRRREGDSLLAAARQRLTLWDLRPEQIRALEQRGAPQERLAILAPVTGTVIEKSIVEGSAVKAGQRLLRVADLSKVWVEGEVYEYELPNVKTGMAAEVILPELPDRSFPATVTYVDPYVDPKTRTARVRVALPNRDGALRPDMYAHVHLQVDQGERLVVPEGAVLYAGHSRVVFVDLGEGRLQPRKIKTGARNGEWIEVLDGVKQGEVVVTSGNFLIAAESKLKAGIDQW